MFSGQCIKCGNTLEFDTTVTYTCERESNWKGLTDEEVKSLAEEHIYCEDSYYIDKGIYGWDDFARAIEQTLKEKNT